ncbi:MAG: hypothetical protein K2X66_15060, partial [Cyanobacteria bacterium]|nr:hypothetical protein [Cyanobacteriota bacterium]
MINFKTGFQSFLLKGLVAFSLLALWGMLGVMGLTPAWGESSKLQTEITWYGQSAFKIVTPQGHVLFVDPWIL